MTRFKRPFYADEKAGIVAFVGIVALAVFLVTVCVTHVRFKNEAHNAMVVVEFVDGSCSGVHVGDGRIITARHCTEKEVEFTLYGVRFEVVLSLTTAVVHSRYASEAEADVIYIDPTHDFAILKLRDGRVLPHKAVLACRHPLIGEAVILGGSPHGLGPLFTAGVVIRGERREPPDEPVAFWESVFLVDGTSGPGMSGGPVYDSAGYVIGIHVGSIKGDGRFAFELPAIIICHETAPKPVFVPDPEPAPIPPSPFIDPTPIAAIVTCNSGSLLG